MNRRQFLHAGMIIPALPIAAGIPFRNAVAGSLRGSNPIRMHKLIFDERFPEGRAFAAQADRLGLSTHAIRGDVTDLWYHDLDLRWRKGPSAIAGMTTGDSLFCLERLAWDREMRVVFRAEHSCLPGGFTEHRLYGPVRLLEHAADLLKGQADWGGPVAQLVAGCPADRSAVSEESIVAGSLDAGAERMPLVSWVIA